MEAKTSKPKKFLSNYGIIVLAVVLFAVLIIRCKLFCTDADSSVVETPEYLPFGIMVLLLILLIMFIPPILLVANPYGGMPGTAIAIGCVTLIIAVVLLLPISLPSVDYETKAISTFEIEADGAVNAVFSDGEEVSVEAQSCDFKDAPREYNVLGYATIGTVVFEPKNIIGIALPYGSASKTPQYTFYIPDSTVRESL